MSKRREAGLISRRATWFRLTAVASSAATLSVLGLAGTSMAATGGAAKAAAPARAAALAGDSGSTCHLGNGVKHVVELTFDNVHFFRDNPNVPSDLEIMPNLLELLHQQRDVPVQQPHPADRAHRRRHPDHLHRAVRRPAGHADLQQLPDLQHRRRPRDPAGSFAYWTDPVFDTASPPNPGPRHQPVDGLLGDAAGHHTSRRYARHDHPGAWVPFTRAGCDVGDVATANQELENTAVDIPKVFGPNSPEAQQLAADPDSFKDAETADYVGIAVHCATNANVDVLLDRPGGQVRPDRPVADRRRPTCCPTSRAGTPATRRLFGHRYVAPQLGAGTPNLTTQRVPGHERGRQPGRPERQPDQRRVPDDSPGLPGLRQHQRVADARLHGRHAGVRRPGRQRLHRRHPRERAHPGPDRPGQPCYGAPAALGSGTACYIAQAQYYNQAFGTFFQRLAADGITPANTVFVVSSDEGDHEAGANVGRAIQPTPANCDGATVSGDTVTPDVLCTYPAGTFGELAGNMTGLLATQKNNTTPFSLETDTAPEFYVTGNPGPNAPAVRTLERDVAGLTAFNPYTGTHPADHQLPRRPDRGGDPAHGQRGPGAHADVRHVRQAGLLLQPRTSARRRPARPRVTQNTGFAWDHGDYAAEINTNYVGLVGPGVTNLGVDGRRPPTARTPPGRTAASRCRPAENPGTWVDETDIRPTLMYLTGLTDDYIHDGRVISEILASPDSALGAPGVASLGSLLQAAQLQRRPVRQLHPAGLDGRRRVQHPRGRYVQVHQRQAVRARKTA